MTAITRIDVTNTILSGNLDDLGLNIDDCNALADLTADAIIARLAQDYPGVPVEVTSDVQHASGVGGGVTVQMWTEDDEFGEMPGHSDERGLQDILQDVSNWTTQEYCEAKDRMENSIAATIAAIPNWTDALLQADEIATDKDQDWLAEATTFTFADGSRVRICGQDTPEVTILED